MSSHRTTRIYFTSLRILVIPSLLSLAACQSLSRSDSASRTVNRDPLSGNGTLADVTIRTSENNVRIAGTTVDGRTLKAQGRTTRQAIDNLGSAASAVQ
jgi:hypothetical protein